METWEPSQHSLVDAGKPRKTCVEVAGRRMTEFDRVWWKKSQLNVELRPCKTDRLMEERRPDLLTLEDGTEGLSQNVGK